MAQGVSRDVETFIKKNVHSVEQLEVLLLLRRYKDREWTPEEVGRELATPAESAHERLRDLHSRRLVGKGSATNSYVYNPQDRPTAVTVDALADTYGKRRVTVIGLIFAQPPEVQDFADSFKLRGDD